MGVAGCATAPPADDPEAAAEFELANDPIEPTNRAIFAFNETLDEVIFKPVAKGYRFILPPKARESVHSFLFNLGEPWNFVNHLLQGDFMRAVETFGRFTMNTTLGVFGLHDAAAEVGLPPQEEDFGQTLAVWGVDSGPYLMLPILGPSNPRDLVGRVVDFFADPFNLWARGSEETWASTARTVARAIDKRERLLDPLEDLKTTSLDYYVAIRSLSRQTRQTEIDNEVTYDGVVPNLGQTPLPSYDFDFQPDSGDENASLSPASDLTGSN